MNEIKGQEYAKKLREIVKRNGLSGADILKFVNKSEPDKVHLVCREVPISILIDTVYGVQTFISPEGAELIYRTFELGGREAIEVATQKIALEALITGFIKPENQPVHPGENYRLN